MVTLRRDVFHYAEPEPNSGCWLWVAAHAGEGYGKYTESIAGRSITHRAHRVVYETLRGPIPAGLVCDHLCRNRGCVNPAHIQLVTIGENVLRGDGPTARYARGETAPCGHPYDYNDGGSRRCRQCLRARERARRAAIRAASHQPAREGN